MREAAARLTLRVRYGETDRMGMAYYASYLDWLAMARTELMRRRGLVYRRLEDELELYLPVTRVECRYRLPVYYDEELVIATRVERLTRARIAFGYRVTGKDEAESEADLRAEATTEHAFVNGQGRPVNVAKYRPEVWAQLRSAGAAQARDGGLGR